MLPPEISEIWLGARRCERLEEVVARYPDRKCVVMPLDFSDVAAVEAFGQRLATGRPRIQQLGNNAGMAVGDVI